MKRFLMAFVMMFMTAGFLSAQDESINIAKPTDNWSVSVQTGYSTLLKDMFESLTSSQYIGIGFEKMITPFFGIEPEISVLIPYKKDYGYYCDNHVLFNAGVNAKFNVTNLVEYDGTRKLFEPAVFVGIGYGRCKENIIIGGNENFLTLRTGLDLTFNIGDNKAWAIVVSPQFVWYDLDSYILSERTMLELTAGVTYHFKTSNGTHLFTKHKYYSENVVNELNWKINKLRKENNK